MKVLVTGGAGFIGSHVANHYITKGDQVFILDNLSTGLKENIPHEAHFIDIDISKEKFIDEIKNLNIDAVVHLAAQSSGEISFEDPVYDMKTNIQATLMLLNWSLKNNVKKFVFSSSMSVYGDLGDRSINESDRLCPKSFYGIGKSTSEQYINIFNSMGLNTTILRLFSVYGPGQNMANMKQGIVSIFLSYIAQNEQIIVKGPLERYRDFVFIDDVVNAINMCVQNDISRGKTYNVCTGRKTTIKELLNIELRAFGRNPESYPIKIADRTPGDQFGTCGDNRLISSDLNWLPKMNLENGIDEMVKWIKSMSDQSFSK